MPVFGDGLQTRAFSHIDDVAPVIARSPLVPEASRNEVFNIGADRPYTILELADEIARAFGVEPRLEHLAGAQRGGARVLRPRQGACEVFDPPEPLELREGIERMAAWVREHGAREPIEFEGEIEVERNLPPSWKS